MQSHRTTTKARDNYSKNNDLNQQLANALIKIQYLKELNAQLIQQNSILINNNAKLIELDDRHIQIGENSSITDDESNYVEDILHLIAEKIKNENDHSIKKTGNSKALDENKTKLPDNNIKKDDNISSNTDNKLMAIDNNTIQKDNDEFIILSGRKRNKAKLIKRLHYFQNLVGGNNYTPEQLIEYAVKLSKHTDEINAKYDQEKISKVPALYLLANPDVSNDIGVNNSSNLVEATVEAFASFKKRGKKIMPAMKRQTIMLFTLYKKTFAKPQELFSACGLNPVSGFRYAAKLRKLGFLRAQSRGISSLYSITDSGKEFLESIVLKHQSTRG